MDFEGTVITIFVALIASVAGGFIAWLFKSNERKTAVLDLADKLEDKRKQVADDVWKRGVSTVENMLEKNEAKTTLAIQKIYSQMEFREEKIGYLRKDFEEFKKDTKRDMEILQTLAFGIDAKSTPPYIMGEEATQLHKDEPGTGMFYEQTQEEQDKQTAENVERQKEEQKN